MTANITFPKPPDISGYTWRHARLDDIPAIYQLMLDVEQVDRRGSLETVADIQRKFDDPTFNLKTNSWLALTSRGKAAAFGWVFSLPEGETEYVAFLRGDVHPEHRGQGLGHYLLSWIEARGFQILAERPDNLPHCLRADCLDYLEDRKALFNKHSFAPVRYGYRMRRDLQQPIPEYPTPKGVTLENWRPELDKFALQANNEAFQDHWGFIPWSLESWQTWITSHHDFRPDLSFLATVKAGTGQNPVVGLCINHLRVEENKKFGINEGWIDSLAVRRQWRGKGIATSMLCASMNAFKAAGLDYAGLGVDTENLTGALHIYEHLGFLPIQRMITYSKTLKEKGN